MSQFECRSPIDGKIVYSGRFQTSADIKAALAAAALAHKHWRDTSLTDRTTQLKAAIDHLWTRRDDIGHEITQQMGRPIRYSAGELDGLKERGDVMLAMADQALSNIEPDKIKGYQRSVKREPLGVVAVMAPWNYPFLTSVNAIIPALAAGNAVILKHSTQTPLVGLRYAEAFKAAGLPEGVFQNLFLTHADTASLISDPAIDYVAFTGSVSGGRAITRAISKQFIAAGLELGGKDPAYVRADANIAEAAENLADGAFFNSGQSCCGIERIYVQDAHFDSFLTQLVGHARQLTLGDPMHPDTTMGPLASTKGADDVRHQIEEALSKGAIAHLPLDENWGSAYLRPQVLTNVNHDMAVMRDESFGPVVGVMSVANDEEAVALMNDSDYGLTASLWTQDTAVAEALGRQLETGTVFMNRCDYLDPALAWTGVKNSGRGCTLSILGYEQLTRPKSYHFKLPTTA